MRVRLLLTIGLVLLSSAATARAACNLWTPSSSLDPAPSDATIGLGCVESDGTVTLPDSDCPDFTLGACRKVVVSECPSVDPTVKMPNRTAWLKIGEPTPGAIPRGTIVLMIGGSGTGWFEWSSGKNGPKPPAVKTPAAPDAIRALQDVGYRTIQVAWDPNVPGVDPWYGATYGGTIRQDGIVRGGCRPATLFRYLYETGSLATPLYRYFNPGTAFCGTGNSSGAAQLAYSLAAYGQGNAKTDPRRIFDAVVLSNGPIFIDLAQSCILSGPTAVFPTAAEAIFETGPPGGQSAVDLAWSGPSGSGACHNTDGGYSPASCAPPSCVLRPAILNQSSLSLLPSATSWFSYPDTSIAILSSGDFVDVTSSFPTCPGGTPADPCCLGGTCSGGVGGSCCWEGDNEYGSAWSAATWNSHLLAQSGHGPVSFQNDLTDQEHNMPARVRGAHALRDRLIAECVPR